MYLYSEVVIGNMNNIPTPLNGGKDSFCDPCLRDGFSYTSPQLQQFPRPHTAAAAFNDHLENMIFSKKRISYKGK